MSTTTRRLVAIVGATATGKTAVGEAIAARLGGEVVCADARQVYHELEIGTGKPTPAERAARPHHLFDLLRLGERASAGRWAAAATAACEAVFARGATPVLVGGSGLYLAALQRGLHPEPPRDEAVRAALERDWRSEGPEAMHARLADADPEAAARLRVRDRQRVSRALEIVTTSGHTLAWWRARPLRPPLAAEWRAYALTCPLAALAGRIALRSRAMWAGGLLEEVRAIVAAGGDEALRRLAAIGYDEALAALEGALDPEAAIARMDLRTRQLAKRQRTWFRHQLACEEVESGETPAERIASRLVSEIHR
jgi:tRNA dimethylallyltransferase